MSSSYEVVRKSKLVLKGDKPHKKKKHSKKRKSEREEDNADLRHGKWWCATAMENLTGPVLLQASDGKYLFAQETATFTVGELHDEDDVNAPDPAEVFTVVALGGGKVAIKSGYDRYLGTSVHGKLTGYKEAVDTLETWTAEMDEEGGVHLKSAIGGKYLTYIGSGEWLCENKETGPETRLLVWCGSDKKPKKAKVETLDGDVLALERDYIKRFQSWQGNKGSGHIIVPDASKKELLKAKKEGLLNEALLDRRSKTKSDRYCK